MPGSASASLRRWLRAGVDLLFPPACLGCDRETETGLVCSVCADKLASGRLGVCPRCGRPLTGRSATCSRCRVPFCLSRVRALGPYDPPYSGLIHALKYDGKRVLAELLGGALTALLESDPELGRAGLLCPVPLHPARLRERGYNQAALLAREVGSGSGMRCVRLLARVRNTPTQTVLHDDRARVANLRGAFRFAGRESVAGQRVILVDDVMTSGATLDAAGRELLRVGAAEVTGLIVAAA